MDDEIEPRSGELLTANYGWTKPNVGDSDDQWGGQLNADLDSIDAVVHGIDVRSSSITISDTAPASPSVGALWWDSVSAQLFLWYNDGNTSQWVVAVNQGGSYYPLGAAQVIGDNRLINGDMRIDQRNNGASGTATGYTCDRWGFVATQAGKITWQRLAIGGVAYGFAYDLSFTSTSAYASLANDSFQVYQIIEADMVTDFAWGTANAQPVTLSFVVYSNPLTGTFSGAIRNMAATRSYPFTFTVAAAGWSKISVTIPGDTAGTWVMSGNAGSVVLDFDLGVGSTYRGPAGAWASATYIGAIGAVSVVGTNGELFAITGVKLEIGSLATPYPRQSLAKSLADCQRYYQTGNAGAAGYSSGAGGVVGTQIPFPVAMRATPTTAVNWTTQSNATGTFGAINSGFYYPYGTATAAGMVNVQGTWTASAEL